MNQAHYCSEDLREVSLKLIQTPTPNNHCSTTQHKQKTGRVSFFFFQEFTAECQTFSSRRSKACFTLPQDKGKFFKRIIPKYRGWLQSWRLFHSSTPCFLNCKTLNPIPVEWNMLLCSDRAFWKLRHFTTLSFSVPSFIMEEKKDKTNKNTPLMYFLKFGGTFEYQNCAQFSCMDFYSWRINST